MQIRLLILAATVVALSGCQSSQEAVKQDPKAAFGRCVANVATWNTTAKHEATAFMGVSAASMPTVFCRRLVNAMLSGRLTFSDINRLQTDQATDVWKVIKGK